MRKRKPRELNYKILALLGDNGAMTAKEIAEALKVSYPTIKHRLYTMYAKGLITRHKVDKCFLYELNVGDYNPSTDSSSV